MLEIQTEAGDLNGEQRHNGFIDELSNWPNITIAESSNMVWSKHEEWASAYDITRKALKKHNDINVIFCHVDEAFKAVIQAVKDSGRLQPQESPDHIILMGVDGSPSALEYIQQGYADCISEQPIPEMARMAVKAAVMAIKHPRKQLTSRFLRTRLITRYNLHYTEHWGQQFIREMN